MPQPPLIDSHCHLDFVAFDEDRDEVIRRAKLIGIDNIIIPGVSANNWQKIQALCKPNKNLHACYGIHPYEVGQHNDADLIKLEQYINSHPCVAIGECGLDYRSEQADKKIQQHFFEAQLDIALKNRLPVVIHSVRATEEIIQQLRKRPGLKGMVHSYSGSYQQALQLIAMGFYISIGGAITYDRAHKLRDTASQIPLTSLLIETDAPDQPDISHQHQRNEPSYLMAVLKAVRKIRKESEENIAQQTTENAKKLFGIDRA